MATALAQPALRVRHELCRGVICQGHGGVQIPALAVLHLVDAVIPMLALGRGTTGTGSAVIGRMSAVDWEAGTNPRQRQCSNNNRNTCGRTRDFRHAPSNAPTDVLKLRGWAQIGQFMCIIVPRKKIAGLMAAMLCGRKT